MPKALAVDWHEVRTLALAIGVREAARRMELPEDTVLRRCSREGWLTQQKAAAAKSEQARAIVRKEQGLSARVRTAAESLAEMGPNSRLKLAVAVNKTARHLSELPGSVLADKDVSTVVLQNTKAGSVLHGWQQPSQTGPLVSLNFISSQAALEQVRPIEAIEESSS